MKKKLIFFVLVLSLVFLTGCSHGLRKMNLKGKIAFIGFRHSIQIMDLSTGKCKKVPVEKRAFDAILSPDGKKVAYSIGGLWVGNVDGTDHRELSGKAISRYPAWSPDGKRIAFWSNRRAINKPTGIYIIDSDGTNETFLTRSDKRFSWSPDGKKIVFSSLSRIYIIDVETHQVVRLPMAGKARKPAWSPDGKKIIFTRGYCGANIYIMNKDESNLKQLTFLGPKSQHMCDNPRWTPDGKKIIYAKGPYEFSFVPLRTFLYIMNPDGSDKRKLKQVPYYGG